MNWHHTQQERGKVPLPAALPLISDRSYGRDGRASLLFPGMCRVWWWCCMARCICCDKNGENHRNQRSEEREANRNVSDHIGWGSLATTLPQSHARKPIRVHTLTRQSHLMHMQTSQGLHTLRTLCGNHVSRTYAAISDAYTSAARSSWLTLTRSSCACSR
ncbi:hypothetical protein MKMG_00027 [Methanogenium sp. MK-MG]|nr:hypothetical protein MKMG_00027 [Methanogenium sp. MK-MG]